MNKPSKDPELPKLEPYEGDKNYIFVSYCRKDAEKVFEIVNALDEKGYRIWYDGGIHGGEDFLDSLAEKIENCAIFLAFLSKDYVEHKYCKKELNQAFRCDKTVIPIMLEEFTLPRGIVFQIDCINWRRVSNDSGKAFAEELCRVDGGILGLCHPKNDTEPVGLLSRQSTVPIPPITPTQKKPFLKTPWGIALLAAAAVVIIAAGALLFTRRTNPAAEATPSDTIQAAEAVAADNSLNTETQAQSGPAETDTEKQTDASLSGYEQKLEAKSAALQYLNGRIEKTGLPAATYETGDPALSGASYTYDNAMTALAYQSEGDYEASALILDALVEGMKNDPEFADRFRNAYMAGDPSSVPGWWDDAAGQWSQDAYQVGTSTQATCAAAVALLRHNSAEPKEEYVDAASAAVSWIVENCGDTGCGFTAGYDGWPNNNAATVYTYKSTADNLWLYAACKLLYGETGWDMFARAAENAKEFITETMYSAGDSRFYVGTEDDGTTPRTDNLVIPAQTLAALALEDYSGLDNITPQADGGYPYLNAASSGSWVEGTAMAALAFREAGENQKAQDALDALVGFQLSSGGFPQATVSVLETGENDRSYSDIPETGACAWFIMAVNGFNPLG